MKHYIDSLSALQTWADTFLEGVVPSPDHATIVTLSGDLGAGKTALVKCCARALGITQELTSPTFVIQKEYPIESPKKFTQLVHIDAYRLTSASELEYLKWGETINHPHTIVFLEWPEMVKGIILPEPITISIVGSQERTITVHW